MTLIKNGLICDGTGGEPFYGDILTDGDTIVNIATHIDASCELIDAGGMLVTPGFIDAHRHCDLAPLFGDFGEIELMQGITTAICGNCGLSPVPSPKGRAKEIFDFIEPCLGTAPQDTGFDCFTEYMNQLEKAPLEINLGVLAASGTITAAVKGYGVAPFSDEYRKQISEYIANAMESGAFGLSCGIMYDPECFTPPEEYIAMAKVLKDFGGYLTAHIRGEGNSLKRSIQEIIDIGRASDIPVNISHFKVTGIKNWGHGIDEAIKLIESNRDMDITADAYPYTGGSTTILSLVPPTVKIDEGIFNRLDFLKEEIERDHSNWDNMVSSIGWENIIITSCGSAPQLCGKSFEKASQITSTAPHELMARLILENSGKVGVILMSMAQEDVNKVLRLDYTSVISDSLYGGGENPHPRLYGAFPRVIRKCVNEDKLFSIETAVKKMTSMPAKRIGIEDRGILKPGMKADILVFSPDEIRDNATFDIPKQLSSGIKHIFINGNHVLNNYIITDHNRGKLLRKRNKNYEQN